MSNGQVLGVVQVLAKEPANGGMLEDAEIRQLGDRFFIVGMLARGNYEENDPRTGLLFWFALDDVLMLTQFSSLHDAQARYEKHTEQQKAKGDNSTRKQRGWLN
jgi:hypothetical protein